MKRTIVVVLSSILIMGVGPNPTAHANADEERSEQDTQSLCFQDPVTNKGRVLTDVRARTANLFVRLFPYMFSKVQEEQCGDWIDNDCDGKIDEDCEEGWQWNANPACKSCMDEKCQGLEKDCQAEVQCGQAIHCVLENRCLDRFLGPVGCICEYPGDLNECIRVQRLENRTGVCARELIQYKPNGEVWSGSGSGFIRWPGPPPPEPGKETAGRILVCLGRFCPDECKDLIRE